MPSDQPVLIPLVAGALALAGVFFVLAGYKASSPYSFVGAERELLQMAAYEPMLLMAAVGMYLTSGSFHIDDVFAHPANPLKLLPIFLGFLLSSSSSSASRRSTCPPRTTRTRSWSRASRPSSPARCWR